MHAKRRRLADRPEIILEAADAVLRAGGARALTIDAVAAEAGLSKGGVLHHFASKDALVLALVARKLGRLRDGIAAYEASLPEGPGRLGQAMLAHVRATYAEDDACSRALLLASIENPAALDGYKAFVAACLDRLAQTDRGGDQGGGQGAVLFFAILGLMMGRALGFHQLDAAALAPMFAALERGAGPADGSAPGGTADAPA